MPADETATEPGGFLRDLVERCRCIQAPEQAALEFAGERKLPQ